MSDYTPSWAVESKSDFDSTADYPDGFAPDYYKENPSEARTQPAKPANPDNGIPPQEPTWGEERHPEYALLKAGEFYLSTSTPDIHRCTHGETVRYTVILFTDDVPAGLWDAERKGEEVLAHVSGTRVGDTGNWQVEIEDIKHTSRGDWGVVVRLPKGEQGVLYRWLATGCLVCDGGAE